MKKQLFLAILWVMSAMLISCGTQRQALPESTNSTAKSGQTDNVASADKQQIAFIHKVVDNQVYAKDIVSSVSFNIVAGSKDINLPGSLRMRKDEVIRIQLLMPIIGSEIARLEFTPEYVLLIDRMNKEYVKAAYSEVSFLSRNGLSFYSLQSLFWNQLLLPGANRVSEDDLQKFNIEEIVSSLTNFVTLKNGNMSYKWNAEKNSGHIVAAEITYSSSSKEASKVMWEYGDFKSVGAKQFPALQSIRFSNTSVSGKKDIALTFQMKELKTDNKWDSRTSVSDKYKQVSVQDVIGKIMKLQ